MGSMPLAPGPLDLHPAIAAWFAGRFPEGPTEPQATGWPFVKAGSDVLIAAPTGSGKTLAGFMMAIDEAYRAHQAGEDLKGKTRVLYVSPLKALAVDVQQNLERPLSEIARAAEEIGLSVPPITVAVRTGDTNSSARAAMVKDPPTILVTTPESLYLYLTAERSRRTLTALRTVIVDEIHALARDKRGSHLALSLERLEFIQQEGRPQRVGLSATQRPIEVTAKLLSGARATTHVAGSDDNGLGRNLPPAFQAPASRAPASETSASGTPAFGPLAGDARASEAGPGRHVEIVDCGHRRDMRVSIELPEQEMAAVLSQEQMGEIVHSIAEHVKGHQTTLVFVNTRRLSERLAHLLGGDPRSRPGGRSPWQPLGRAPPADGVAFPRRRTASPGRHSLAGAGDRHRSRRAGLPGWLPEGHRHVLAASRPVQPLPARSARRHPLPHHP